jgi:hypothetical protein
VSVTLVLVLSGANLAALGMMLFVFCRVRPEVFKIDAGATRWLWLKVEMRSPRRLEVKRDDVPRPAVGAPRRRTRRRKVSDVRKADAHSA